MQRVLELDGRSRMNVTGTPTGNWEYRFVLRQLQSWHIKVPREMSAGLGRAHFSGVSLPQ